MGTTNSLVNIGESLYKKAKNEALTKIESLYADYLEFIKTLYKEQEYYNKGKTVIDTHFGILRGMLELDFTEKEEKVLLAQGELISTNLFHYFLSELGLKSALLPALDFMTI